jgi:hypothetical protein
MVQGSRLALTTDSPANLLRPYAVTGAGGSCPCNGRPRAAGPAAAMEDT